MLLGIVGSMIEVYIADLTIRDPGALPAIERLTQLHAAVDYLIDPKVPIRVGGKVRDDESGRSSGSSEMGERDAVSTHELRVGSASGDGIADASGASER
jgi:hypothetical protein